ncbi:MAG: hypothetical protein Q9174_002652 [Haloplaca sp. 1 TL-2023]
MSQRSSFSSTESASKVVPLFRDEQSTYFPLFVLADAPGRYFNEVYHNTVNEASWLSISSANTQCDSSGLLSEIKANLGKEPTSQPFLGSTVGSVYEFFKNHVRKNEDVSTHHAFTHFTFLAVDEECFNPSSPLPELPAGSRYDPDYKYTILVCTDAPDFNEGDSEPKLKVLRLPLDAAGRYLETLEQLNVAPSEVQRLVYEDPNARWLKMNPMPILRPIEPYTNPHDQEYQLATPAEARKNKKAGIRSGERNPHGDGACEWPSY